jgi:hypothetical protein
MAVLEVGINLGMRNLVEIRYYPSSDDDVNAHARAKFLDGLGEFIDEVFGDEIDVISLSSFNVVCYYEMVQSSDSSSKEPLLSYAIIEKDTNPNFVKQHLQKIISDFLDNFSLNEIYSKSAIFFERFKPRIDKILGDLKSKLGDRIKSIF